MIQPDDFKTYRLTRHEGLLIPKALLTELIKRKEKTTALHHRIPGFQTIVMACQGLRVQWCLLNLNTLYLNERQALATEEDAVTMIEQGMMSIELLLTTTRQITKRIHDLVSVFADAEMPKDGMRNELLNQAKQYVEQLQITTIHHQLKVVNLMVAANTRHETPLIAVMTPLKQVQTSIHEFRCYHPELLMQLADTALRVSDDSQRWKKDLSEKVIALNHRCRALQQQYIEVHERERATERRIEAQVERIESLERERETQQTLIQTLQAQVHTLKEKLKPKLGADLITSRLFQPVKHLMQGTPTASLSIQASTSLPTRERGQ